MSTKNVPETTAPKTHHHDPAELMDSIYRLTRHVYDVTRKYYLFGRDTALQSIPVKDGDVVVEVGCGTARNLRHLAKLHPTAKLAGIDASAAMLETAGKSLERAGIGNVPLVHGFAEQFDPKRDLPEGYGTAKHFLYSYCLTMIPPWRAALDAAWKVLPEGGTLNIVDFGTMGGLPAGVRWVFQKFLAAFHVHPKDDIHNWADHLDPTQARVTRTSFAGGYAVYTRVEKRQAI